MKKQVLVIVIILAGIATVYWFSRSQRLTSQSVLSGISENEARNIAEKSCIKGGESLADGVYNKITKTWWFDANLNAARDGCNPACVVWEETRKAEINWRCTGLIIPTK